MADIDDREPNLDEGIEYWNNQPATYDGVLGGFGEGVRGTSIYTFFGLIFCSLFLASTR